MTSAAAVSRALSRAGLRPLPSGTSRTREGIRVTRAAPGAAWVNVDMFDHPRDALYLAAEAAKALRAAGFTAELNKHDRTLIHVTRQENTR
jgi:hypothetical protein